MAKPVPNSDPQDDPQIIISVPRVKDELRIPASVTGHDHLFVEQINETAAWVGNAISAPVLDQVHTDYLTPLPAGTPGMDGLPWEQTPIRFEMARWIREIESITWWDSTGALRSPPNQTIRAGDMGRQEILDPGPFSNMMRAWPGIAGWPTDEMVLAGSRLQVNGIAGLDMAAPYAPIIRRAVVEGVRQLSGGYPALRFNSTFEKLLSPLSAV